MAQGTPPSALWLQLSVDPLRPLAMSPQFDGTPQPMPIAARTDVQLSCQHYWCRDPYVARNSVAFVLALTLAIVTLNGVSEKATLSYRPVSS